MAASDLSIEDPSSSSKPPPEPATVVIPVATLEPPPPPPPPVAAAAVGGGYKVFVDEQKRLQLGKGAAAAVVVEVSGDGETVCRICHLGNDWGEGARELIQLGCGCKDELGIAHRQCGEAWFRLRGNRCCEICGATVKNITGEDGGSFMEEWHGVRVLSTGVNVNTPARVSCWRSQPFCNFLMVCLVIAFILPWFFHVSIF